MFTGLITDVGTIEQVADGDTLKRVRIASTYRGGKHRARRPRSRAVAPA